MPPQTTTRQLPHHFSPDVLVRNLAALDVVDSALGERLRWPVDDSRVRFDEHGAAYYRVHRTLFPLRIPDAHLAEVVARVRGAARVVLLGLGLGEAVETLLSQTTGTRVVAWERDPWLMRLTLMRRDYAREIGDGRLRLALASDLLSLDLAGHARVPHPLLERVYAREVAYLERRPGEKRAALCAGGLFVGQLAAVLEARGFDLWTIEIEALARGELDLTMERFAPRLVASINFTEGVPAFCRGHGAKLLCWEVDPSLSRPLPQEVSTDDVFVFTHRRDHVEQYRDAGFAHVEYMPLAADPEVRVARALPPEERPHPVSFVGASMVDTAQELRKKFVREWVRWRGEHPDSEAEGEQLLSEVLREQRAKQDELLLPELIEARAPGFLVASREGPEHVDPMLLAAEMAASEKRLGYVANLGALGVRVWGDPGWKLVERHGVTYMGRAAHGEELTGVYNESRISVDVGRLYQNDIVTMRVFDVLACGSFMIAEHNDALAEAFDVGAEVESYRTVQELVAKTRYYLEHPAAAAEIARRGREKVLAHHTVARRVDHMLAVMGEAGARSVDA